MDKGPEEVEEKKNEIDCTAGFYRKSREINVNRYDIWVIPVHINNIHWTLLVVHFKDHSFIYLDSCHGGIPPQLIIGITEYMSNCDFPKNKRTFNWSE